MPLAVIDWVNQRVFAEGQPYLLIFHDRKYNPIVYDDIKIAGVDEAPGIKSEDEETDEEHQYNYDTTDVDIWKYDKEDHEEYHKYHEHNSANIEPPQDDNHDAPK